MTAHFILLVTCILLFTSDARIGLVIPNNFESFQLICPEGSPFPCATTNGEFTLQRQYDLANHRVYEGYFGCEQANAAITTSGLGTINAALTTQLLIDRYRNSRDPIDMVLTYGIAVGMDDRLSVGDVLVASKWSIYNQWVWQDEDGSVNDPEVRTRTHYFDVSEDALNIMKSIETDIESKLLSCTPDGSACLSHTPQMYTDIEGEDIIGITAPIFVDSSAWRSKLFAMYGAQSIDMETGSVAMVAATNEIPFLAFRSLSDLAGADDIFMSLAVQNSITVLLSWLDAAYCQNIDDGGEKKSARSASFDAMIQNELQNEDALEGNINSTGDLKADLMKTEVIMGIFGEVLFVFVGVFVGVCCYRNYKNKNENAKGHSAVALEPQNEEESENDIEVSVVSEDK